MPYTTPADPSAHRRLRTPRVRLVTFASVVALGLSIGLAPTAAQANLEDRVDQLEDLLEGRGLSEMLRDLERLKRENQQLRGEIEELQRAVRLLEERQQDHYIDFDERIQEIETAGTLPAPEREPDRIPVPDLADDDELDEDDIDEGEQYRSAFRKLSDGLFEESRDDFKELLEAFPDGRYAANARYWIAETYYAERSFEQASEHFEKVLEAHEDSDKVPDALLKLGFVAFEEGDLERAEERLNRVRDDFPDSTAASLAQQRLSELRQLRADEVDAEEDDDNG